MEAGSTMVKNPASAMCAKQNRCDAISAVTSVIAPLSPTSLRVGETSVPGEGRSAASSASSLAGCCCGAGLVL